MSNKKERGCLRDIVQREFAIYVLAVTEAGHDWVTWPTTVWPPDSHLEYLRRRFVLARECAAAARLLLTTAEITDGHTVHLAYRRLVPNGPPDLTDEATWSATDRI